MATLIRIGVRAHDFGRLPAAELAAGIAAAGFTRIQLAPGKALAEPELAPDRLDREKAGCIRDIFAERRIGIAVLGCYINPIHPDLAVRKKVLDRFAAHLRLAHDMGCGIVGTETGSILPDCSFHPGNQGEDAFAALAAGVARLVATAEQCGVVLGIEPAVPHVIATPDAMRRLLYAVPSKNLRVILDPVNLLTEDNYNGQERIMRESFALFGDRLAALHLKDFVIEEGRKKTVPAGEGLLDTALVLRLVREYCPDLDILLENTRPETAAASAAKVRALYRRAEH